MNEDFFEKNNYFIDRRNSVHEYYHIYNSTCDRIGIIKQKVTIQQKILRMFIGKTWLPFSVEIRGVNGRLQASVSRKSMLTSKIIVENDRKEKVGVISKKLFRPEFKVLNSSNKVIAEIRDAWKGPNFIVYDSSEQQIGTIDTKWNGAMKGVIRSSNSYKVDMMTHYLKNEEKVAILSSSLIINMFFFN